MVPLRRDFSLSNNRLLLLDKFGPKKGEQDKFPIVLSLLPINQWIQTLFWHGSLLEEVFGPDKRDLGKRIKHGENHPDVNHLDVGGRGKGLAHPDETEKVDSSYDFCLILLLYFLYQIKIKSQEHIKGKYLQSWEDKHDGKVNLDDHGDVLVGEAVDHLAQEHQHASRQGHLDISCFHARNLFCSPWENLRRQVGQGWPQQQRLASRPTGLSTWGILVRLVMSPF